MAQDGDRDDLVTIDRSGVVQPLGASAALRLQSRAGTYRALPAPSSLLVLQRAEGDDVRPCVLGGEIRSAGAMCDVLSFVGQRALRGELVVFHGADHRSIFFDQGNVVGARSSVVRERLGEVLYRHGVLTREQVDECAEASLGGSLRFGEAAVRQGFVDRQQLFGMMGRQIEEIVYGVLLVDAGAYWMLEGFEDTELASLEKLPVAELVRQGVRRMHEARFFRTRVPSERHVPVRVTAEIPPQVDFAAVHALIDGERSIADLCRALGEGEFDVMRTVFQLAQAGYVAVRPPRASARESVRIFNEAISLLLRELDAIEEGDQVRGVVAAFVAERPAARAMLEGAGPADDGTYDAIMVEKNVGTARADEEALAAALYEIASYALFLARPHLHRTQPTPSKRTVSLRVTTVLEPIAGVAGPAKP